MSGSQQKYEIFIGISIWSQKWPNLKLANFCHFEGCITLTQFHQIFQFLKTNRSSYGPDGLPFWEISIFGQNTANLWGGRNRDFSVLRSYPCQKLKIFRLVKNAHFSCPRVTLGAEIVFNTEKWPNMSFWWKMWNSSFGRFWRLRPMGSYAQNRQKYRFSDFCHSFL